MVPPPPPFGFKFLKLLDCLKYLNYLNYGTALLTHIPRKDCHVFGEIYEHLPPDKQDLGTTPRTQPLRV